MNRRKVDVEATRSTRLSDHLRDLNGGRQPVIVQEYTLDTTDGRVALITGRAWPS